MKDLREKGRVARLWAGQNRARFAKETLAEPGAVAKIDQAFHGAGLQAGGDSHKGGLPVCKLHAKVGPWQVTVEIQAQKA